MSNLLAAGAELEALDFSGFGLGQAVHDLDFARIGVIADDTARHVLDLRHEVRPRRPAGPQRHVSLDDVALQSVRLADHGGFGDGRVVQNGAFDLEGPDAVSGTLDDVAGPDPAVPEEHARALRILPIAERIIAFRARALRQVTDLAGRQLMAV